MNRIRQRTTALVLLLLLVCEMGFAQALTPGATGCCGHCGGVDGTPAVAIVVCEGDGATLAAGDAQETEVPSSSIAHRHGAAPCTNCGLHCGMSLTPFVFLVATPAVRGEPALVVTAERDVRLPAAPPGRLERPPRFISLVS